MNVSELIFRAEALGTEKAAASAAAFNQLFYDRAVLYLLLLNRLMIQINRQAPATAMIRL